MPGTGSVQTCACFSWSYTASVAVFNTPTVTEGGGHHTVMAVSFATASPSLPTPAMATVMPDTAG